MIVKNLNFGVNARTEVFKGIQKLTQAVSSTLGASGKCVILEDAHGNPSNYERWSNCSRFNSPL